MSGTSSIKPPCVNGMFRTLTYCGLYLMRFLRSRKQRRGWRGWFYPRDSFGRFGRSFDNLRLAATSVSPGALDRWPVEVLADFREAAFEITLDRRYREVAARAFENASHGIGVASQAARHGIGIVKGDEDAVYLVHNFKAFLAMLDLAFAERIKQMAAQLADHLRHAVQIGGKLNIEVLGAGDLLVFGVHNGQRQARLRVFLLGIVDETREKYVPVLVQGRLCLGQKGARTIDEASSGLVLAAMHRPDTIR